jgi:hypothetical protein
MKWFTLNSSAIRESGESLSEYEAWVHGRKVVSEAAAQGTTAPELSLHFRIIERPYNEGDDALDAIAADQINCYRKLHMQEPARGRYIQR